MNSPTESPGPPLPKLLDRVDAKMRLLHYSKRTEGAFLTPRAVEGNGAASTQNRAFSAISFLDQKPLKIEPPKLNALRARRPEYLPVVLPVNEVRAILVELSWLTPSFALLCHGARSAIPSTGVEVGKGRRGAWPAHRGEPGTGAQCSTTSRLPTRVQRSTRSSSYAMTIALF